MAVGLCGDRIQVGLGSEGGWADFGPERRITRAQGQVLYELDGRPALDLYKDYLGDLAASLPAAALRFPLSVRRDAADGEAVVRTILGVDEVSRALIFAGDIPQGGTARLMRVNHLNLIESGGLALAAAAQAASPQGACPLPVCQLRRAPFGARRAHRGGTGAFVSTAAAGQRASGLLFLRRDISSRRPTQPAAQSNHEGVRAVGAA